MWCVQQKFNRNCYLTKFSYPYLNSIYAKPKYQSTVFFYVNTVISSSKSVYALTINRRNRNNEKIMISAVYHFCKRFHHWCLIVSDVRLRSGNKATVKLLLAMKHKVLLIYIYIHIYIIYMCVYIYIYIYIVFNIYTYIYIYIYIYMIYINI